MALVGLKRAEGLLVRPPGRRPFPEGLVRAAEREVREPEAGVDGEGAAQRAPAATGSPRSS